VVLWRSAFYALRRLSPDRVRQVNVRYLGDGEWCTHIHFVRHRIGWPWLFGRNRKVSDRIPNVCAAVCSCTAFEWEISRPAEYLTKSIRADFRSGPPPHHHFFKFRGRRSRLHSGLHTIIYLYHVPPFQKSNHRYAVCVANVHYVFAVLDVFLSWDILIIRRCPALWHANLTKE